MRSARPKATGFPTSSRGRRLMANVCSPVPRRKPGSVGECRTAIIYQPKYTPEVPSDQEVPGGRIDPPEPATPVRPARSSRTITRSATPTPTTQDQRPGNSRANRRKQGAAGSWWLQDSSSLRHVAYPHLTKGRQEAASCSRRPQNRDNFPAWGPDRRSCRPRQSPRQTGPAPPGCRTGASVVLARSAPGRTNFSSPGFSSPVSVPLGAAQARSAPSGRPPDQPGTQAGRPTCSVVEI